MLPSLSRRTWFGGDVSLRGLSYDRAATWGGHRDFLPSQLVAAALLKGLYAGGWLIPHLPFEAMRSNSLVGYCPGIFRASPGTTANNRCAGPPDLAAARLSRRRL